MTTTIEITVAEASHLRDVMGDCERTAEGNGWEAEQVTDIAGRTWGVASDAAWTINDADDICQVFSDSTDGVTIRR